MTKLTMSIRTAALVSALLSIPADGVVAQAGAPALVVTIDSLVRPESMQYDERTDAYFITQIVDHAVRKTNRGRIARARPDGSVERDFIAGGKNGVELHSPKGLTISGDTIWVADVDAVRLFNTRTGAPIATFSLAGDSLGLFNDIAMAPDGGVYATDSGIFFPETGRSRREPALDRVFHVTPTGRVTTILRDTVLGGPNGVQFADGKLFIASLVKPSVFEWSQQTGLRHIVTSEGGFDGIIRLPDGRTVLSNNATGEIVLLENGGLRRLLMTRPGAADLGFDSRRNRLLIPYVNGTQAEVWQL